MQGGGEETMSSVFTLYNSKDLHKICVCSYFLTHDRLSLNEMHVRAHNSQDFLLTFFIFIFKEIVYYSFYQSYPTPLVEVPYISSSHEVCRSEIVPETALSQPELATPHSCVVSDLMYLSEEIQ